MRLHGPRISELGGDGEFQYTILLAGVTQLGLGRPGLCLAIQIFEVLSYPDVGDQKKFTKEYRSEADFYQQRIKWPWGKDGNSRSRDKALNKAKNELIKVGLLKVTEDGDWHWDTSVIPRNRLESKRQKPEEAKTGKATVETTTTNADLPADSQKAAKPDKTIKRLPESQAKPFTPQKPTEAPEKVKEDVRVSRGESEWDKASRIRQELQREGYNVHGLHPGLISDDFSYYERILRDLRKPKAAPTNPPLENSYEKWHAKQKAELMAAINAPDNPEDW